MIKVFAALTIASEFGSFKEGQYIPHGRGKHQVPTATVTNWVKCGSAVVKNVDETGEVLEEMPPFFDADGREIMPVEELSKLLSQNEEYDQVVNDADEEAELAALSGAVVAGGGGGAPPATTSEGDEDKEEVKAPAMPKIAPKPAAKPKAVS